MPRNSRFPTIHIGLQSYMKPKLLIIITRSEVGGAQNYVLSMIKELQSQYTFSVIVGSDAFLSKHLRASEVGIEAHIIPELNSANLFKAISSIREIINQIKPDLINTHSALASFYGRLANYNLGIPIVYSVHGWFFTEHANLIRKVFGPLVERELARITSFWITETAYDLNLGIKKGAIKDVHSAAVIANGIPSVIQRNRLEFDNDNRQIAFIGRICNQKNPFLAVSAFEFLPENYSLTLYCDDAHNKGLNGLITKLGLTERIKLIDNEYDTAAIIGSFELLLVTSRYEGMPLSVIEAMSVGLPIVATDVCGLNELVDHLGNGILVSSPNARSIAVAIQTILGEPKKAEAMGERSKEKFLKQHTLKSMSKKLDLVFQSLVVK